MVWDDSLSVMLFLRVVRGPNKVVEHRVVVQETSMVIGPSAD